jgi:glycine/D-amino acid oxidase-like deaminating enzyme
MVTAHRNLRTGRSLWQHMRAPRVPHAPLTRNIETDVLIVGAGITGAMIGEELSRARRDAVVVDRRGPAQGSTAASTALVQYEIDTPLVELKRRIGERNAIRAWRRSRLAVTSLQARLRALGIDTESRDALYLAGNRLNARGLKDECKLRRMTGLETEFLGRAALRERFGIARSAALLGFDNFTINPRAAAAQLLDSASAADVRLFAPVEVTDIEMGKRAMVARTRDGPTIRCRMLVLATGYEFPKLVPLRGHRITSTWAIATKPQRARLWPEECLIWEAADPYLYIRTTPDARVICGGEDAPFLGAAERDALISRKVARIRHKLGRLFPRLDTTPEFAWTASFGVTSTGLPSIGPIPGHRNCWASLGYGGNGITYSRIASELVRTGLTGGTDPDADLFAFR